MSQLHTISTPPPTHPEWTAAMTGCGHFSITRNDSWSFRINFLNIWALLEGSWLGFIRSPPMSMRSRPIKSQDYFHSFQCYYWEFVWHKLKTTQSSLFWFTTCLHTGIDVTKGHASCQLISPAQRKLTSGWNSVHTKTKTWRVGLRKASWTQPSSVFS